MSALAAEYIVPKTRSLSHWPAEADPASCTGPMAALIGSAQQEPGAMRLARRLLASWLQRCLRQGAYHDHPRAVAALPADAILQQLQQATGATDGALDIAASQTDLQSEFAHIDKLVVQLAAASKAQPGALRIYDELVERGLGVLQRLAEIEIALTAHQAGQDPLTGLPGRRELQHRLLSEHARLRRHAQPCCLVLIDLDDFKPVNDRYGHAAGDTYLAAFADLLRGQLRPYDAAFRYGGDEFVLCLPQSGAEQAQAVLERMRERLAAEPLLSMQGQALHASFSAGIAAMETTKTIMQTLEAADARLYEAKTRKDVRHEPQPQYAGSRTP